MDKNEIINIEVFRTFLHYAATTNPSVIVIDFDQENGVLSITDDGDGFVEMDSLSNFAETGWLHLQEIDHSHPCYIFLKASRLSLKSTVESKNLKITLEVTDDNDQELKVSLASSPINKGTKITFYSNPDESFVPDEVLPLLVVSFSISVFYNGKKMGNDFAINGGLKFSQTTIGDIHVASPQDSDLNSNPIIVYVNGFYLVQYEDDKANNKKCHIVHMDNKHPVLKTDDRHQLEEVVRKSIAKLAKQLSII